MQIVAVEAIPIHVPLDDYYARWAIALGPKDLLIPTIIVRMRTDAGLTGYGEAAPHPAFSSETPDSVRGMIERHLAPALLGMDPCEPVGIEARLSRVVWGNSFAKAAVEMAAWDIAGKALGVPISRLLGGRYTSCITTTTGAVGIWEPSDAAVSAARMVEAGATTIKIKIGRDIHHDVARVLAVRETIGPEISIHVDANQGYSTSAALALLRALQPYDIDLVEQPVPAGDLAGLAAIRQLGVRVMVDESVYTPADLLRVIQAGAADVVMVKTGKHGGVLNSHRICVIAEAAGLTCGIASMGHFIDRAVSLQLAGTSRAVQHPNMLAQFFPWTIDTLFQEPLQSDPSWIRVPDGPGIGVAVDEGRLEKYRVR